MCYRMIKHRWFLCKKWPCSRRMASASIESQDYERAISVLNSLQTNAEVLEEVRKEPGHIARKFAETGNFLNRVGIDVTDLDQLNIVHIAGTKGKGSVCCMCESILRVQGLKTGFYSSPHLVEVRERIRLNGQPLSKELFVSYFWECYNNLKKNEDKPMPSYFMFLTIMAYKVFLSEQVDVAITEVGIGGTFDCTNVVQKPKVCAISSLGYDHTDILGKTLSEIAGHKAGIFKAGVPAFTSTQSPEALKTLLSRSKELGSLSLLISPEPASYPNTIWDIGIPGSHQCENASLAVQVCRQWLTDMKMWTPEDSSCHEDEVETISDISVAQPFVLPSTFVKALKECHWPGRCQIIKQEGVSYFLDGAHTMRSLQNCKVWFQDVSVKEEISLQVPVVRILLFNFMGRRDREKLLSQLLGLHFSHALFCPNYIYSYLDDSDLTNRNENASHVLHSCYDNESAWLKLTGIHDHVAEIGASTSTLTENNPRTKVFTCISEAIEWIGGVKDQKVHVQVLVCGSLHLVGGVMKLIGCTAEKLY